MAPTTITLPRFPQVLFAMFAMACIVILGVTSVAVNAAAKGKPPAPTPMPAVACPDDSVVVENGIASSKGFEPVDDNPDLEISLSGKKVVEATITIAPDGDTYITSLVIGDQVQGFAAQMTPPDDTLVSVNSPLVLKGKSTAEYAICGGGTVTSTSSPTTSATTTSEPTVTETIVSPTTTATEPEPQTFSVEAGCGPYTVDEGRDWAFTWKVTPDATADHTTQLVATNLTTGYEDGRGPTQWEAGTPGGTDYFTVSVGDQVVIDYRVDGELMPDFHFEGVVTSDMTCTSVFPTP